MIFRPTDAAADYGEGRPMEQKAEPVVIELSRTFGVVVYVCTSVEAAMVQSGLHELFHAGESVREAARAAHQCLREELGAVGCDEPDFYAWSSSACKAAEVKAPRLAARFFHRDADDAPDARISYDGWRSCTRSEVPRFLVLKVENALVRAADAYDSLLRREACEI
jgi:hypothetical protein